jgi:hypothetical protein
MGRVKWESNAVTSVEEKVGMKLLENQENTYLVLGSIWPFIIVGLVRGENFQQVFFDRWLISLLLFVTAFIVSELAGLYLLGNQLNQVSDHIDDYCRMVAQRSEEEERENSLEEQAKREQKIQQSYSANQYKTPKKPYS